MEGVSNERIREEFYSGLKKSKSTINFMKDLYDFEIFSRMFPKLDINTEFIEYRNPIVVISNLLKYNDSEKVFKILTDMKYLNIEKKSIKFLIDFLKFFKDNSYSENISHVDASNFSKLVTQKKSTKDVLDRNDFIYWSQLNNINTNVADVFFDFNLKNVKDIPEIEAKLSSKEIFGKQISDEVNFFNFKEFISLV